jgi:predicted Ser/Thr protein kinase
MAVRSFAAIPATKEKILYKKKGKSKVCYLLSSSICRKVGRKGAPKDTLKKQAKYLVRLASLGFVTSKVIALEKDYLDVEYIAGPSLKECIQVGFSAAQVAELICLVKKQKSLNVYIGDLNHNNLIWDGITWVIIDCGSIRENKPSFWVENKLQKRVAKWGLTLHWQ